ncbi:uncharacterized protein TRUGW13939_05131 [Talaromyces rugulosus]|uniref:Aminoglycoside phosphotransferase domain-containing protein n=1 Tax=Talaromyces rugulosus TaxID=121627 RepID=A0A7H8QX40_TALRU|nr:uncharacterized protein TRUGW13939_05131 [Talaromyces rugulosus]QKX58011.1 hypothetical protein TRUGW13939_05131 [Talaromyces rugulosus]
MPQQKIPSLKTYFDEIEETNGDDECKAWLNRVFDLKAELANFVATHRAGGGSGKYICFLKGSFNFSFRFSFNDGGPDAIIRFPKPGHTATAYRDEKVTNEVQVMEYLRQHTNIPIPSIHSWGLLAESPQQLGPFIIMDYVEGVLLSTILKQPDQEDVILNPDIDNTILDKIYGQIASYMLQLLVLRFLASEPSQRTTLQRNLADGPEIAQARFIARHRFAQLISKYYYAEDGGGGGGPFIPFCDDMRPSNMLVNPETLCITAVLDFEFTNAMPAEFTYDPPWWLLLSGPEMWLERCCSMDEFLALYEPRMAQFLQALEQVEKEAASECNKQSNGSPPLSTRMRYSWRTGRFWFDYAARKSFDVDMIYWAALHNGGAGVELLDDKTRTEMESFTQTKMEQLKVYKEECTARFSSER